MRWILPIALLLGLLHIFNMLHSAVGCMDRSKNGYLCNDGPEICCTRRYDDKVLHYVTCYCDCDRYLWLTRKGQCSQCRHYREFPEDVLIDGVIKQIPTHKSLNRHQTSCYK